MIAVEQELDYVPQTLTEIMNDITYFSVDGNKYILNLESLKKPEDIITVLKHFASRVELRAYEVTGIESYVKPISATPTH